MLLGLELIRLILSVSVSWQDNVTSVAHFSMAVSGLLNLRPSCSHPHSSHWVDTGVKPYDHNHAVSKRTLCHSLIITKWSCALEGCFLMVEDDALTPAVAF
jgi:hypothetical protein